MRFSLLDPESRVAAQAALAAAKQGKYIAVQEALLATKGRLTDDQIYGVARSVEFDVPRLKLDMALPPVAQMLRDNLALAGVLRIRATPTFIIGSEILPGVNGLSKLKALVATTKKGDAFAEKGTCKPSTLRAYLINLSRTNVRQSRRQN